MVQPIKPEQVQDIVEFELPDDLVLEVFNELIVKHMRRGTSLFPEGLVIETIMNRGNWKQTFDTRRLLDVYKEQGWIAHLIYVQQGSYFCFKKP